MNFTQLIVLKHCDKFFISRKHYVLKESTLTAFSFICFSRIAYGLLKNIKPRKIIHRKDFEYISLLLATTDDYAPYLTFGHCYILCFLLRYIDRWGDSQFFSESIDLKTSNFIGPCYHAALLFSVVCLSTCFLNTSSPTLHCLTLPCGGKFDLS